MPASSPANFSNHCLRLLIASSSRFMICIYIYIKGAVPLFYSLKYFYIYTSMFILNWKCYLQSPQKPRIKERYLLGNYPQMTKQGREPLRSSALNLWMLPSTFWPQPKRHISCSHLISNLWALPQRAQFLKDYWPNEFLKHLKTIYCALPHCAKTKPFQTSDFLNM